MRATLIVLISVLVLAVLFCLSVAGVLVFNNNEVESAKMCVSFQQCMEQSFIHRAYFFQKGLDFNSPSELQKARYHANLEIQFLREAQKYGDATKALLKAEDNRHGLEQLAKRPKFEMQLNNFERKLSNLVDKR